jgi:hypothetical protein
MTEITNYSNFRKTLMFASPIPIPSKDLESQLCNHERDLKAPNTHFNGLQKITGVDTFSPDFYMKFPTSFGNNYGYVEAPGAAPSTAENPPPSNSKICVEFCTKWREI